MQFRADINGLRALAVVAVMMFHYDVPGFSGGYIGVDIFFVISGFLMTQIICSRMLAADSAYTLLDFYRARAWRILPALVGLAVVLLVLGALFLIPMEYATLGRNALSALLFVSNIVFWRNSGYFETVSHDNWLLHTWSLSVEWQFYLILPLLLVALHRFRNGRHLRLAVVVLAVLSLLLSGVMSSIRPAATFYLLPTRCWELFAGGIAFFYQQRLRQHSLLDLAALACVGACIFFYDSTLPFPGYWALPPVAATALLLAAGSSNFLLGSRPAQFLGKISYSLYLWHWPFMVGMRYFDLPLTIANRIALVGMALLLACLSYRWIEMRFRGQRPVSTPAGGAKGLASAAALAIAVLASASVFLSDGLPGRLPTDRSAMILANQTLVHAWDYPERCRQNFRKQFSLTDGTQPVYCMIGAAEGKKLLVWGDSMAEQLYPALKQAADAAGPARIILGTYGGCVPIRNMNRMDPGFDCPGFNQKLFDRARESDINTVILGGAWAFALGNSRPSRNFNLQQCMPTAKCGSFASAADAMAFAEQQLMSDITALTALGKQVVLILPFPEHSGPVALYMARGGLDTRFKIMPLTRQQHAERTALAATMLHHVARQKGVRLIDPAEVLCSSGECEFEQGGRSLYGDTGHLTPDGARLLTSVLACYLAPLAP